MEKDGMWQLGKAPPLVSHANTPARAGRERSCQEQLPASLEDGAAMATGQRAATRTRDTISVSECRGGSSPLPGDRVLVTLASRLSRARIVSVMSSPGFPGERFLGGSAPETRLRVKWFASPAIPCHAHTL